MTLRTIALWAGITVLTLLALYPGLQGGFYFDDAPNIVENNAVHLSSLSLNSLKASLSGPSAGPLGRPVSVLSFGLTHAMFGLDAFAFKAINLAIHLINGLLVGWLAAILLQCLRGIHCSAESKAWLPYWIAAAWLVHPIHFAAIMMAVQRMTLLATMFTLLALIFHLKAMYHTQGLRMKILGLICAWLIFWPLAVFSKETGLLFPLLVLVIVFFSAPSTNPSYLSKRLAIRLALAAMTLAAVLMFWRLGLGWLEQGYATRPFSLSERLLTEARVLWFYVAQTLLPSYPSFGLYLDDFPLSTGLLNPQSTLPAILGIGSAFAVIFLGRRSAPVLGFAAAWFLAGHSIESSIIPLEIIHEHRNYLPSIGLLFGVAFFGANVLARIKMDHPRLISSAAAVIPIALLVLFTWLRSEQAANPLVGTQIEATRHPESARANQEAALALMSAGYGGADDPLGAQNIRFYLEKASTVDSNFKVGYLGLVTWACATNRPVETQWLIAIAYRLEHTPFTPNESTLPDKLLKPLVTMSKCLQRQDALRLFDAGANNPRARIDVRARFLENASDYELLVSHKVESARSYLEKAVSLVPHDHRIRKKLLGYTR